MFQLIKKRGFTLVEILIAVAIIGVIAAIAIPHLLRARISANEASAKVSIRSLATALETYRGDQNPATYPSSLTLLASDLPPYIDPVLGTGYKQGYYFQYFQASPITMNVGGTSYSIIPDYSIHASPQAEGQTGISYYYTNSTGVIYSHTSSAGSTYSSSVPSGFTPV